MGSAFSARPKRGEITEADRAVLTLRTQRRKLINERKRVDDNVERDLVVARQLVAANKKDRALLLLRRKRLQEKQLDKLDAWLLNVEEILSNVETAKQHNELFAVLKEGNNALKQLQSQVSIADVDRLLQESADAKEYEESMKAAIAQTLTGEEDEAAESELAALEAAAEKEAAASLPSVPAKVESQAVVEEGISQAEAPLELPAVPKHKVQVEEQDAESIPEKRIAEPLAA